MTPEYLSLPEAQRYLNMGKDRFRALEADPEFPRPFHLTERKRMYRRAELDAFMDLKREQSA